MEWAWIYLLWSIIILAPPILFFLLFRRSSSSHHRLPPGPPGWPVFGHMFNLGSTPYRTLAGLEQQYGPVVWLKLGSVNTMVILTAKATAEFFKNRDLAFAERTITHTMRSHDYHKGSLALAPYGTFWRVLRRVCTVEMLVNKRILETASVRMKCVDHMLTWIERESLSTSGPIHVARIVFLASFNMLGNLMLSRDLVDPESTEASVFFKAMMGIMEWSGRPNIGDLFPWLRWVDPQGLRRNADRDLGITLGIASGYVKERIKEREEEEEGKELKRSSRDFLDVLLDYEGSGKDEPAKLSEHEINIFILEIFLAGSETASSTVEWVLTELLCSPEAMAKAKEELVAVVGPNRKFEESDIENLQYLQAVIKETLRLHPPLPFLFPRRATEDTNFMGYHIPKNTQVLVNAWAIGRDQEFWDDPMSFKPERFLGSKVDYRGQHYEFIPFGAGRRMCAGVPLGHRMLHLVVGTLLHEFDWDVEGNVTRETMDWKERMGITVRKFEPLKAIPRKCKQG